MTFLTRGSGFISRKIARVAGSGKPLPAELEPYLELLQDYSDFPMLQAWSLERARPTRVQLKVPESSCEPDLDPNLNPD